MTAAVAALVGPTAAGKSALAMEWALASPRPVEIVAVDAMTLYRGMDVATAKPGPDDRDRVPHHLVDELDPGEAATVAWFQTRAREVIADIRDRGVRPLLVGGSGLYFRAVVDDLTFPPTDHEVRSALASRYADDPRAAHAAVVAADPDAAAKIDPNNLRRSVRALEVMELTGARFSDFAAVWEDYNSIYEGLEVRGIDLPDDVLRERIEARATAMVADGLLAEAWTLRGGALSHTARQAIGYAEAFAVLDGDLAEADLAASIATRTWRYARKQRGWFRRDPRIRWQRNAAG